MLCTLDSGLPQNLESWGNLESYNLGYKNLEYETLKKLQKLGILN